MCICIYSIALSTDSLGAAIPPIQINMPETGKEQDEPEHLVVPENRNMIQECWGHVRRTREPV